MFKFISVDTIISVDSLLKDIEDGGWMEFVDGEGETYRIDANDNLDREELVLRLVEVVGLAKNLDIYNFYPLEVGVKLVKVIESITNDFDIHTRCVVLESFEYKALAKWLVAGNYFSIGTVNFSKDDIDSDNFLSKYFGAKHSDEIYISDERGREVITDFFSFCKKSIVEG